MPITPVIHWTVAYSNAVLTAMLPHFTQCAKQLDLPIPLPITISQVAHFAPPIHTNYFQAAIWLTNGFWLDYAQGSLEGMRSPDNLMLKEDPAVIPKFVGKDDMTTNEAIDLARSAFTKLGHSIAEFHLDRPPTRFDGPADVPKIGHLPFCRAEWNIDTGTDVGETNVDQSYNISFDIDMGKKQIVGLFLSSRKFWTTVPKIDVVPEMEPDGKLPPGLPLAP